MYFLLNQSKPLELHWQLQTPQADEVALPLSGAAGTFSPPPQQQVQMSTDERAGVLNVRNIRKHLGQTVITSSFWRKWTASIQGSASHYDIINTRPAMMHFPANLRPQLVTFGRHRLHPDDCWSAADNRPRLLHLTYWLKEKGDLSLNGNLNVQMYHMGAPQNTWVAAVYSGPELYKVDAPKKVTGKCLLKNFLWCETSMIGPVHTPPGWGWMERSNWLLLVPVEALDTHFHLTRSDLHGDVCRTR